MTLRDVAMATAARSVQPELGAVSIEMKTRFMRSARRVDDAPAGAVLRAQGRLLHRTASIAFTEAKLFDAAGRACAHATSTFNRTTAVGRAWAGCHSTRSGQRPDLGSLTSAPQASRGAAEAALAND